MLFRLILAGCLAVAAAFPEVHVVRLRDVAGLVIAQNSDVAISRLDERKAAEGIHVARDPFTPRVTVGSGLAYSSGYPMSIDGAAPSIVQARAAQFLFNRQQSYLVSQAREQSREAGIAGSIRREQVVHTASRSFLDTERSARELEIARKQIANLAVVSEVYAARIAEGRELPIESRRAALNLARARQRVRKLEADVNIGEMQLASQLGYGASDLARPAHEDRAPLPVPPNEEEAVNAALARSLELKRYEAAIAAKQLGVRANNASRLPRVDLVAQYALFAKFNNFEDFFRRFQRNNGQLGVSFQFPVLTGSGAKSLAAQDGVDLRRLRLESAAYRNNLTIDTRRAYGAVKLAESGREVAALDLEVAREQVTLLLAQLQEGRAAIRNVEEARFAENEKWLALYDARYLLERAQIDLLQFTGDLVNALRGTPSGD